jgi:hypothetical protein
VQPDRPSFDKNRAAAALAGRRTAVLGRDHSELFAKGGEEVRVGAADLDPLAVENECGHGASSGGGTAPRRSVMSLYWSGLR